MRWFFCGALLTVVAACAGDPPFDEKQVALLLAQAECACSEDDSCIANEVRKLHRYVENGVAQGSFALSDETLAACEDQIESCQASTPACDALLSGSTPPEGACTQSAECKGDAFCRLVPGAADSPYCPGVGKCEARVARDEPCTHSLACSGGLTCVATAEPGLGACGDPVPEGGACYFESVDRESVYALCAGNGDLVCASDGTCKRVSSAAPPRGASCNYDYECAAEDFCASGRCDARLTAGQGCETIRQCARDLTCKSGTCRPASDLGRGCDPGRGNADCLSPWVCDGEGVCRDQTSVCFGPSTAPPPVTGADGGGVVPSRTALGSTCNPGEDLGEEDPELFCATDGPLQGVVTRQCSRDEEGFCEELDGLGAVCITGGLCARSCASDSECAFGLRCDVQLAVCTR